MRVKDVWDKLFPLQRGERVKVKINSPLHEYRGRTGKIDTIFGQFVHVELDHAIKVNHPRKWKFIVVRLEDLRRIHTK